MDSWWAVAASVFAGLLLLCMAIVASVLLDAAWPLLLGILASFGLVVTFAVRKIRAGKTEPVTTAQQTQHRVIVGVVLVVALIVIWLAR